MKNLNSMKYVWLILLAIGGVFQTASAQQAVCGSDQYWQQQVKNDPSLETARIQADNDLRQAMNNLSAFKAMPANDVLTIPIVFHIISSAGYPVNPSLSRVHDQLAILNADYSASNSDTSNVRPIFKDRIGNAHVKFVLATKDPNGNPSTGLTHDTSILTAQANDSVKTVVDWPNTHYLNVWVVYNIDSRSLPKGSTIAGYSTFPWGGLQRRKSDGIILDHTWLGIDRTLSHEIGHFLGLYHTFQGECNPGDEVDDTPPVLAANLGKCNSWPTSDTTLNSCHNDIPDLPDMLENIMDYATCKVMFTKGQVNRLRYYLTLNRVSLYYDNQVAAVENTTASSAAISLFPNPANQDFTVQASGLNAGKTVHVKCFDMMGRLHLDETVGVSNEGDMSHEMDINSLTPGVYQIMIYEGNEMKAVKALVKN